jgi:indolepyruvate ferredoxin oxidoreductase
MPVQERLREIEGVSAIIYVQTCAAEKRRRRKRGSSPTPTSGLHQHRCLRGLRRLRGAVELRVHRAGRDRTGPQARHRPVACNKDFSCLKGFCPSFVTLEGAQVQRRPPPSSDLPDLPEPDLPAIDGTHNVVITGVGGTGVVTIGAVLAQAAQIDGKGAGMMEMAGLAQKGGAVHIHCRLAERPEDISAIRVATGEATR